MINAGLAERPNAPDLKHLFVLRAQLKDREKSGLSANAGSNPATRNKAKCGIIPLIPHFLEPTRFISRYVWEYVSMKHLHITLENKEFAALKKKKNKLNWHDYILISTGVIDEKHS